MATPTGYQERSTAGMSPQGGVREATHRFREARSHAGDMFEDASERMSDMVDQASHWVQDNSGKLITTVGVLAAVGFVGYLIGRNNVRTSDIQNI